MSTDQNRSYPKILAILVLLGLTITSCQDFLTKSSESDAQIDLEEVYADKLGPDQTLEMALEEWGLTMEELEAAHRAAQNRPKRNYASSDTSAGEPPQGWESDYGTQLTLGADDCQSIEIGFPFTFYGESYSSLWVNSNGNVTFDACNERWWPTDIPDSGNRVIAGPLYGDFEPQLSDKGVYVNTVGVEPNRTFVVTWLEIPAFEDGATELNTFQLQLAEGSNAIYYGYNGLSTDGINTNNDKPMNMGISDGADRFINSASGEEIPELDFSNICYSLEDGEYREVSCGSSPLADAGLDQTVECAGDITSVSLDGTGTSDPDGDPISYSWSLDGREIATGATPSVNLPMDSYTLSLTATDSTEATDSDEVSIDIVDTSFPELSYGVPASKLWPPNNKMQLAVRGISTFDVCDSGPSLSVSVTDSESGGSANWNIVENGDGTYDVYLRAKRQGSNGGPKKVGRIYSIRISSEDASANVAEETVKIVVPHSMGRGK